MLQDYVCVKSYTGSSPDDLALDIQQLEQDGSLVISNPVRFIVDNIFDAISGFIDIDYSKGDIMGLFSHNGQYSLELSSDIETVHQVMILVDNDKRIYACDYSGDEINRLIYNINSIDDEDIVYVVQECIIHPEPGIPVVTRCHHAYFTELSAARNYYDDETDAYSNVKGVLGSGFRLFPMSLSALEQSDWYKENMEIINFIEAYGLDRQDYTAILDLGEVKDALKADSYDNLSFEDQCSVNRTICRNLYQYLPEDKKELIGGDFDVIDDSMIEATADDVILWALVYAPDKETFDAVHAALKFNDYRVGALTDMIFTRYSGHGYILMDRAGEMKWYKDAYAINEWDQSKQDPYHGKFQRNEADTLLCLREYHPELLVKDFPPADIIKQWDDRYKKYRLDVKMRHDEMTTFDSMDYGDPVTVCRGNWYRDGIMSDDYIADATFPVFYGTKVFSRNECRKLLSGEEIIIENYQTRSGIVTTIRGKLGEGDFDSPFAVEFVRTDIDFKRRKQMEIESGIV